MKGHLKKGKIPSSEFNKKDEKPFIFPNSVKTVEELQQKAAEVAVEAETAKVSLSNEYSQLLVSTKNHSGTIENILLGSNDDLFPSQRNIVVEIEKPSTSQPPKKSNGRPRSSRPKNPEKLISIEENQIAETNPLTKGGFEAEDQKQKEQKSKKKQKVDASAASTSATKHKTPITESEKTRTGAKPKEISPERTEIEVARNRRESLKYATLKNIKTEILDDTASELSETDSDSKFDILIIRERSINMSKIGQLPIRAKSQTGGNPLAPSQDLNDGLISLEPVLDIARERSAFRNATKENECVDEEVNKLVETLTEAKPLNPKPNKVKPTKIIKNLNK